VIGEKQLVSGSMLRKQFWRRAKQNQDSSQPPSSVTSTGSVQALRPPSYHIMVDRLVLDGITLAARERPLLQTAVETELARLLGENGLSSGLLTGGAMSVLPGGSVQLSQQPDPIALGQQIAQAVYGGMRR
jgi:hypothetical protein